MKTRNAGLHTLCSFTSLLLYFILVFLSRNGGALPAAVGTAAKRACRLQERRSFEGKIQMPGGGGGASVTPLNFCMCIPCLPGPPCVTV
jgi:hypothetical protein